MLQNTTVALLLMRMLSNSRSGSVSDHKLWSLVFSDQLQVLASVYEGVSMVGYHLLYADSGLHLHVPVR